MELPITLVLLDDHRLLREGLRALLAEHPEFSLVGDAADATSAVALCAELAPRVAVVDLALPGGGGLGVTRDIVRASPMTQVLILTATADPARAVAALAAGARGYAVKTQATADILDAIRTVVRGERYVAPMLAASVAVLESQQSSVGREPIGVLSAREREIFDLAVRGFHNEQIAAHLHISIKTVETHRSNINRKLDLHSTADLVRFAARWGLIAA